MTFVTLRLFIVGYIAGLWCNFGFCSVIVCLSPLRAKQLYGKDMYQQLESPHLSSVAV